MKNITFISGIISANLMLFGSIFKVQHWPGANVLLTLAIAIFCLWFLPVALINSYKSQEVKKYKSLYIVTFFVFFVVILGALFKIMHWPGAGWFLVVGIPLPFVVFLPVYIYSTRNDKKDSMVNFLGIMFGLIFLAVFSAFLAVNISFNVLSSIRENIVETDQTRILISEKNKAADKNSIVSKKANELCAFIDDLKCKMFLISENAELCTGGKLTENYCSDTFINFENEDAASIVLFKEGNFNILRTKINEFSEVSLATGVKDENLKNLISYLFDTVDKEYSDSNDNRPLKWEERAFSGTHLISVINGLSRIQLNVRFVEAEL